MKFVSTALALAAFATSAAAQLKIISPGGPNLWWVAQSQNTLLWSCQTSPYQNFTVLIANGNPDILTSPLAIISEQENYDCSESISQYQVTMPAASNYTLIFANILNSSDAYAVSEPFEIKALGASYPPASATPTGSSSASAGASGTSSSSGAAASSASAKKSGAGRVTASLGGLAVLAAGAGIVMA